MRMRRGRCSTPSSEEKRKGDLKLELSPTLINGDKRKPIVTFMIQKSSTFSNFVIVESEGDESGNLAMDV